MDTSRYSVGVMRKSVYVQGSTKGVVKGNGGSPTDVLTDERRPNVKIYAKRWEQGLDLWTGEPLTGEGLADWERRKGDRRNQLE